MLEISNFGRTNCAVIGTVEITRAGASIFDNESIGTKVPLNLLTCIVELLINDQN
jgi:hypothetical protein